MKSEGITRFIDSPTTEELHQSIFAWRLPTLSEELMFTEGLSKCGDFWSIGLKLRSAISSVQQQNWKNHMTLTTLDWLYAVIRQNVKRGRVFDLREVLKTGKADCLGYCKLFTVLGRYCGLNTGVVDVIVDNRGIAMPHSAILIHLLNRKPCCIDFWYGSKNPHHRRLGLRIKYEGHWKVVDKDFQHLKDLDYTYLPDTCVDGITLYIEGNRALKNGEYVRAIEEYSRAIRLYPLNARVFYNRAIAYEKLGNLEKAKRDYARALKGEAAITRTLAVQPEEVVNLIALDAQNVPEEQQQMYLLRAGFVSGKRVPVTEVAQKAGISVAEADSILGSIESMVAKKME